MTYKSWYDEHAKKHHAIVQKLSHLSDEELIEYFEYDNMVQKEPEFCVLYAHNKKCHNMQALNCYLCACPNFRFDDASKQYKQNKKIYSLCAIKSKDGAQFVTDTAIHQNCAGCTLPHEKEYIQKHFSRHWLQIMQNSPTTL